MNKLKNNESFAGWEYLSDGTWRKITGDRESNASAQKTLTEMISFRPSLGSKYFVIKETQTFDPIVELQFEVKVNAELVTDANR